MKATGVLIGMTALVLATSVWVAVQQSAPVASSLSSSDGDARLAAMEERLERMEGTLNDVRDTSRKLQRRIEAAPRRSPGAMNAAGSGATGAGEAGSVAEVSWDAGEEKMAAFEDQVATRVETAVAAKMESIAERTQHRGPDGKWKPPMDSLQRQLGVDADRAEALKTVFDGARDEAFALLNEQRSDGGTLLDDLSNDIAVTGDLGESVKRFFSRLTTENVPGRDQTYLAAFGEMEERVRSRVEAQLDERGVTAFRDLNVDVFEVQTGYDPVGEYIKDRLAGVE